jgi:PAS domain S-box-containing protein
MGASSSGAGRKKITTEPAESEKLWTSEKMVRALLESASQAILSINKEGRILLANARTAELFGYERDELLGQPIEILLPEAYRNSHVKDRSDYFKNPRVRPMGMGLDLAGRRKNGTEFPVEISLSFIEADGQSFGIAFVTDITKRKQLEDQLVRSQKMEAVGRLAGGVAHDFNNMLTIIAGYNRMMLDNLSPMDPMRGYAEEVLKASDRAAALTTQLLAFSRRQVLQPRVLDINSLIVNTEKMLRRLIGEDLEVKVVLSPGLGKIKADPGQIEQVIFNLAINARDAMPTGGRITIETANVEIDETYVKTHFGVEPGDYVMMAVSDNGSGMDAETKSHIFEPFFTTKQQGKGTGLGLSTVYGIVKQSGGDIWVYSEPGKGTAFKIYFPRVLGQEGGEALGGALDPVARGTETILVVEDEAGVRKLLCELLRKQGFTVLEATDGREALRLCKSSKSTIHLLLTDVVMPDMSGHQIAEQLAAVRPKMKVLYMSGYTENTIVHHGVLNAGVQFLSKPFTQETLLAKVREVLK